jgi:hypothetical protein
MPEFPTALAGRSSGGVADLVAEISDDKIETKPRRGLYGGLAQTRTVDLSRVKGAL